MSNRKGKNTAFPLSSSEEDEEEEEDEEDDEEEEDADYDDSDDDYDVEEERDTNSISSRYSLFFFNPIVDASLILSLSLSLNEVFVVFDVTVRTGSS